MSMNNVTQHRLWLVLGACALAMVTAPIAGCNWVAPAVYLIHGPDKIKPQYQLPLDRPAVVFVDDRDSVLPNRTTRQKVSKSAEKVLLEGKAVAKSEIIDSNALLPIATQERFGKPSGIAQVGESVGAEVVIYAKVEAFALSPNGQEYAPVARAKVKVIDAKSRKRLWPTEQQEWYPIEVVTPTKTSQIPRTLSERLTAENELAELLGRNLARVFVEYSPEEVSERVGGGSGL